MIYLLAVVDQPGRAAAALSAATDYDVMVVPSGPLACIGIKWGQGRPDPDPETLTRHDAMIRALMRACTVVPFRFATLVADTNQLSPWLAGARVDLESLLGRVRGRVEMALRASTLGAPSGEQRAAGSGRDYLQELRRDKDIAPVLSEIHDSLAAVSAGSLVAGDSRRISGSYLVDAGREPTFRERAEELRRRWQGLATMTVTGPWAPYSFVTCPALTRRADRRTLNA